MSRPPWHHQLPAPFDKLLQAETVDSKDLVDQHKRRMGRILTDRDLQRVFRILDILNGFQPGLLVGDDGELVPGRVIGDDPHRQGRIENPEPAIGLGQQRRRVDEGHVDIPRDDVVRHDRRAAGELERGAEIGLPAGADRDAHIAIAAIGNIRIARNMQPDLPQHFRTSEIGADRQRFHCLPFRSGSGRCFSTGGSASTRTRQNCAAAFKPCAQTKDVSSSSPRATRP